MATARWPWRGRGLGPVALATFFHFKTGDAIVLVRVQNVFVNKLQRLSSIQETTLEKKTQSYQIIASIWSRKSARDGCNIGRF
jgi:hypothetical protein